MSFAVFLVHLPELCPLTLDQVVGFKKANVTKEGLVLHVFYL